MSFLFACVLVAVAAATCNTGLATSTCLGTTLQNCSAENAQKCACLQTNVATCVREAAGCEFDAAVIGLFQLQIAGVQRCEQPAWTALPSADGKCSASGDVYNKNRLQSCALRNGWPSVPTADVCGTCLSQFAQGLNQWQCAAEQEGAPWMLINLSYKCNATLSVLLQANPYVAAPATSVAAPASSTAAATVTAATTAMSAATTVTAACTFEQTQAVTSATTKLGNCLQGKSAAVDRCPCFAAAIAEWDAVKCEARSAAYAISAAKTECLLNCPSGCTGYSVPVVSSAPGPSSQRTSSPSSQQTSTTATTLSTTAVSTFSSSSQRPLMSNAVFLTSIAFLTRF